MGLVCAGLGSALLPPAAAAQQQPDSTAVELSRHGAAATSASAAAPSATSPSPPLRLRTLLEQARRLHPAVRAASSDRAAAVAKAQVTRAGLLPQLLLSGQYRRTTANFVSRPGYVPNNAAATRATDNNRTDDFYAFALDFNQLIYDFGRTTLAWRSQKLVVESTQADLATAEQSVLAEVYRQFFAAAALQAQLQVQARAVVNQRRHLALARSSVEAGVKAPIELAQAQTSLASAQLAWVRAQGSLNDATVQLLVACAQPVDVLAPLADDRVGPLPCENEPLGPLVARALGRRPHLRAQRAKIEAQKASYRAGKASLAPSLNLAAEVTEQGRSVHDLARNWYVGLNLNWPLFSGLADLGRWRAAAAEADAMLQRLTQQEQEVAAAVARAQIAIHSAISAQWAAAEAKTSAAAQLRQAEGRFVQGVGSFLELDDAQVAATEAEGQLGRCQNELYAARAALAAQLGDLEMLQAALVAN